MQGASRGRRARSALVAGVLAATVVAWVRLVDAGTPGARGLRTDADFLYLPALWQDVVQRGASLDEWVVPPSPYLVPDGLVFVVGRLLGGTAGGLVLASAGQLLLLVVTCYLWARWSGLARFAGAALAVCTTAVLYGLFVVAPGPFAGLTPITNHGGVAIAGTAWLGGLVATLVGGARPAQSGLLVVTGGLLACSDGLFNGVVVAAAVVLVVLVGLLGPPALRGRRTFALLLVPLAAAALGELLVDLLPVYVPAPFGPQLDPGTWIDQLADMAYQWRTFTIDEPLLATGYLVLLALLVWRAVGTLRHLSQAGTADLLALAATLVVAANLAVVPVVGVLTRDPAFTRYYLPALLAPFIALGTIAWSPGAARAWPRPGRRALVVVGAAAVAVAALAGPAQALAPPDVACLDAVARRHDLRYGVSSYWDAKPITLWSQEGLRVGAVDARLQPAAQIQNVGWSWRDGGFDFAVVPVEPRRPRDALDPVRLREQGDILTTVPCGAWEVVVYGERKLTLTRD